MAQNLTVDASRLEDVCCVACGGKEFAPRVILKYLPGILSPNGAPAIVTLADGVRCVECDCIITMQELQHMARNFKADPPPALVTASGTPMQADQKQTSSVISLTDVRRPKSEEEKS